MAHNIVQELPKGCALISLPRKARNGESAARPASLLVKTFLLLIACGALIAASSARADVTVEGRKLPWTATIPSGWVGGTYEKIEKILAEGGTDSGKQSLDKILRPMLKEAKEGDALFYHLDVQGTATKTLSSLWINVVPLDLAPLTEEKARTDFWNTFAKQVQKDLPEAKIEVTRDRGGHDGRTQGVSGNVCRDAAHGRQGLLCTPRHRLRPRQNACLAAPGRQREISRTGQGTGSDR